MAVGYLLTAFLLYWKSIFHYYYNFCVNLRGRFPHKYSGNRIIWGIQ